MDLNTWSERSFALESMRFTRFSMRSASDSQSAHSYDNHGAKPSTAPAALVPIRIDPIHVGSQNGLSKLTVRRQLVGKQMPVPSSPSHMAPLSPYSYSREYVVSGQSTSGLGSPGLARIGRDNFQPSRAYHNSAWDVNESEDYYSYDYGGTNSKGKRYSNLQDFHWSNRFDHLEIDSVRVSDTNFHFMDNGSGKEQHTRNLMLLTALGESLDNLSTTSLKAAEVTPKMGDNSSKLDSGLNCHHLVEESSAIRNVSVEQSHREISRRSDPLVDTSRPAVDPSAWLDYFRDINLITTESWKGRVHRSDRPFVEDTFLANSSAKSNQSAALNSRKMLDLINLDSSTFADYSWEQSNRPFDHIDASRESPGDSFKRATLEPLPLISKTFSGSSKKFNYSNKKVSDLVLIDTTSQREGDKKLTPVIFWEPVSELVYRQGLGEDQLNAISKDYRRRVVMGKFLYTPPLGTVLPAGTHTLSVKFIPENINKYRSAESSAEIKVLKKTPQIQYEIAEEHRTLTYGTLLDIRHHFKRVKCIYEDEQEKHELSHGKFFFSHKPKTLLEIGKHCLRVEFEPNEDARANYSRGFAAVEILVVGAEVELVWDLPMTLPPIVFPSLIPEEYFCAKTVNEEVTGLFCYRSVNKNGCSAKEIRIGNNDVIDIDGLNKLAIEQQAYDKKASKPGHSTDSTELSTGASTEHLSSFQSPYPNKNTKQNCLPEQIEPLTAGKHSLFVDFYPDNTLRYRVSSISTEIQINKGIIPLEWPKPPVIHAGDELDETVLNCGNALNLPGRYVYTPSFGATFTVGEKILSVLFEPEDSSNWNCAKTSIKLRVMPKKVPLIYWSQPYPLIHPEPLSKLQLSANTSGFLPGSMEYLPTFGTVLDVGEHELTVKFIPAKKGIGEGFESTVVTVSPGISRLVWSEPDSILEGEAIFDNVLNCRCTNLAGGTFVYDPPRGTVLPAGINALSVRYIPDDARNYSESTISVKLLVRERPKLLPELFWRNPVTDVPLIYPSQIASAMLCATITNNAKGMISYSPAAGAVLGAGTHELLAEFTPHDSKTCLPGSVTSTIVIVKGLPIVEWEIKEDTLEYGTPLTENQLNAKCKALQGIFEYLPPVGAILESGEHLIICKFLPKEENNYECVELSRIVFVQRTRPIIKWESPSLPLVYPTYLDQTNLNPRCLSRKLGPMLEVEGEEKNEQQQEAIGKKKKRSKKGEDRIKIGDLLSVGTHNIKCRFYPDDLINYLSADAEIVLKIAQGSPIVTWNPTLSVNYESALNPLQHLNASCNLKGGYFTYDPPAGTVLEYSEDPYKLQLLYEPDDNKNYKSIGMVKYIQVVQCIPRLEWAAPHFVNYGKLLDSTILCAELSASGNTLQTLNSLKAGTFEYRPPLGTLLLAGEHKLTVTFRPPQQFAKNYAVVTTFNSLMILKSQPQLVWTPKLILINEGTPLGEAQLCAYVKKRKLFAGEITYSCEGKSATLGTVLPIGRHLIRVDFTSSFPENYNSVTKTIWFDVVKRPPKIVTDIDPLTGATRVRRIVEGKK